jgi:hypothetical protein
MRQLSVLFLTLLLGFKAHALDSIEDYIKEYPNPGSCQPSSTSKPSNSAATPGPR